MWKDIRHAWDSKFVQRARLKLEHICRFGTIFQLHLGRLRSLECQTKLKITIPAGLLDRLTSLYGFIESEASHNSIQSLDKGALTTESSAQLSCNERFVVSERDRRIIASHVYE